MITTRPFAKTIDRLRAAGLRPTRQRMALGRALFDGTYRHVTAEGLYEEICRTGARISLATVYNALHQFTEAGLLCEISVDPGKSFFDTNTSDHHHVYYQDEGRLEDIPTDELQIDTSTIARSGYTLNRLDVILRMTSKMD